jgi:ribosomal protein S18 acetylase RimI-like enzyme
MAVTEKAQGKKVGQKLLSVVIEKTKAQKANPLILETNSKRTQAIHLYRKYGFTLFRGINEILNPHKNNSPVRRLETVMGSINIYFFRLVVVAVYSGQPKPT